MRKWFFSILILSSLNVFGQESHGRTDTSINIAPQQKEVPADSVLDPHVKKRRTAIATAATVIGYGGSFILLNRAWYQDYPRSSFHTYNDAGEWLQVDKVGHAWTSYTLSRVSTNMWRWAGMKESKAVLLGSGSGLAYLLAIEYLDGRSAEWGWSWADVGADLFGTGLYAAQQLGWKEQKFQLKFSAHHEIYDPESLNQRADELFGTSIPERLLKDYNQQSYWLSMNLKSVFKWNNFPSWLNLSIGYGAEGMFGGYENVAYDEDGNIIFDRRDIKRYRQWYLSPDIDFTKIKTRSRFLRSFFSALNVLKFPAPALELSNGKLHFKAIVF